MLESPLPGTTVSYYACTPPEWRYRRRNSDSQVSRCGTEPMFLGAGGIGPSVSDEGQRTWVVDLQERTWITAFRHASFTRPLASGARGQGSILSRVIDFVTGSFRNVVLAICATSESNIRHLIVCQSSASCSIDELLVENSETTNFENCPIVAIRVNWQMSGMYECDCHMFVVWMSNSNLIYFVYKFWVNYFDLFVPN